MIKWLMITVLINLELMMYGQTLPSQEIDLGKITDDLLADQDELSNYEALYENLLQILSNPINLNKATAEDLSVIRLLTSHQIESIIKYRNENGNFISVYELQAVPELDPQTIQNLAPFIKVIDPHAYIDANLLKRIRHESENMLFMRVERSMDESVDHKNSKNFSGSPEKILLRFRSHRTGDFSFGFCGEKDAGEPVQWKLKQRYYGVDYLSCHAQLQNKGRLKNIIIGDYQAQFGQGLMIGGVFGMGKGSETITAVRGSNIGLLPYTSAYEAGFLRGVGLSVRVSDHVFASVYYSHCKRDAGIDTNGAQVSAPSLQTTGLHRTSGEIEDRKQVGETNFGAILHYNRPSLETGVMFTQDKFDVPLQSKRTPYNQFAFSGTTNHNVGAFVNYTWNYFTFFGELAYSLSAGDAYIFGLLSSLTPKLDVSMLYRSYDPDFYSRFSNAFGENSTPQNERGIYWGWKYRITKKMILSGYLDLFTFPWARYRAYAPSVGFEWLLRFTYQPSRNVLIFAQAREESKIRNDAELQSAVYQYETGTKNNYWIHFEIGLRDKLRLKSRAQFSTYRISNKVTSGFVLAQDIKADIGKFQLTGRFALFDTDDYDNRQYVYENDVLLAYSMPAYYGVGVRKMIMLRYKFNRYFSLWIRYAETRSVYPEKVNSSSQLDSKDLTKEIKIQVRIQF